MGRENVPKETGKIPERFYETPGKLNLKWYCENQAYRKLKGLDTLLKSFFYYETIEELTKIFLDEKVGLDRPQIQAIKQLFSEELEKHFPVKQLHGSKNIQGDIEDGFLEAERYMKQAEMMTEEARESKTEEIEKASTAEEISLSHFEDNPHYRLFLREENPYFQKIIAEERINFLKRILKNRVPLMLTNDQTEQLVALAPPSQGKELHEIAGLEIKKDKMLELKNKKERQILGMFSKLLAEYDRGFVDYPALEKKVKKIFAETGPSLHRNMFEELRALKDRGEISQEQFDKYSGEFLEAWQGRKQ